jgi:MFS family permease
MNTDGSSMKRDIRLIASSFFLWGLGEGLFTFIQPLHLEQLGANPVQIGGVLAAYSIVGALCFLPGGMMADRWSRKWVMWGGYPLGCVAALLMARARTWQGMVPGMLLYSVSMYGIPATNAYLADRNGGNSPLERDVTSVFACYAGGAALSPALGGWVSGSTAPSVVYYAAAVLFSLSTLAVTFVSSQPARRRDSRQRAWRPLLDRRFLRFAGLVWFLFVALYLGFPLTPNFLADVRGLDVAAVGALGTFQAMGEMTLCLVLGRIGSGRHQSGLMLGQLAIWVSVFLLSCFSAVPVLAVAYFLRGAYLACRSMVQARSASLGDGSQKGLLLGATDTVIAMSLVVAPYIAGWLYLLSPSRPFIVSLSLMPVASLAVLLGLPHPSACPEQVEGGV